MVRRGVLLSSGINNHVAAATRTHFVPARLFLLVEKVVEKADHMVKLQSRALRNRSPTYSRAIIEMRGPRDIRGPRRIQDRSAAKWQIDKM
jgi:hypothetical protein